MPIKVGKPNEHLNVLYWLWLRPGFDYFNPLILYLYPLGRHNIAQEANLILMEPTLLQIGKKAMSPEVIENPPNGFDVSLARVFSINQDVV